MAGRRRPWPIFFFLTFLFGGVRTLAEPGALGTALARDTSSTSVDSILKLPHTEVEDVRVVLLPTNVADRRGRIVRGLTRDDFRLWEDQTPQEIKYFTVEDQDAIEVAFLLDVSGSMRLVGRLEEAKDAIEYFLASFRPKDRFALICFADEQVSWVTTFTSDRERFLNRLRVQEGYGQTALNDAIAAAPRLVEEAATGKRAIILITDGVDNASRLSTGDALALARRASVPIYTIGFSSIPEGILRRGETQTNLGVLSEFADATGAGLFPVHDPDDLKEAIVRIVEELRYQYVIGYQPQRKALDGSYRAVRLEARRRGLEVRTRKGYFADP